MKTKTHNKHDKGTKMTQKEKENIKMLNELRTRTMGEGTIINWIERMAKDNNVHVNRNRS